MFCYACMFDLIVLDLIFICNGLVCIFLYFFCVSLDHFRFVICNLVLLGLVFLSTKPRDWLGRTSPKWPISCEVGRKILHSSAKYTAAYYSLSKKIHLDGAGPLQRAPGEAVRPSSSIIVYFDVVRRNVNKEELDLHNTHIKIHR